MIAAWLLDELGPAPATTSYSKEAGREVEENARPSSSSSLAAVIQAQVWLSTCWQLTVRPGLSPMPPLQETRDDVALRQNTSPALLAMASEEGAPEVEAGAVPSSTQTESFGHP